MSGEQASQRVQRSHRPGSRRAAAARIVWGVILLPPLLCWAALGLYAAFRHAPHVDTGDRLLDLFLQEMIDRDQIIGPHAAASSYNTNGLAGLPPEIFDGWKAEFGDDPRLYHLRDRYTAVDYSSYMSDAYPSLPTRTALLNDAVARGIADPAILARLISYDDRVWKGETYELSGLNAPDYRAGTVEQWDAYIQQQQSYIDSRHAAEQNKLLAALLKAAPDQAMPLYYAANLAWRRGDMPATFRLLREGNAAPKNDGSAGYPWDELRSSAPGAQISVDPLLYAGLGSRVATYVSLQDIRHMSQSLVHYASERGDLAALGTLHVFAYRYANLSWTTASRLRSGATRMLEVQASLAGYRGRTAPAQKQALSELETKIKTLQNDAAALRTQTTTMPSKPPPNTLAWWREMATNAATGGRSRAIRQLRQQWDNAQLEQQGIEQKLRPEIEELLRFDYATLSWK